MCVARARGRRSRVQCQLTLSGKFTSGKFASGQLVYTYCNVLRTGASYAGPLQSVDQHDHQTSEWLGTALALGTVLA